VGKTALQKVPAVQWILQVILRGSKNRVQKKIFAVLFHSEKGLFLHTLKQCRFSRSFCACNNNHFSCRKMWPGFSGGNIVALCLGKTDVKSFIFPRIIPGVKSIVFHEEKSKKNVFILLLFYSRKNGCTLGVVLGCALALAQGVLRGRSGCAQGA
jgi:hypothetical protein